MNILHIIGGDLNGGAAKGAYWLHLGLINNGINSKLLVQKANIKEKNIIALSSDYDIKSRLKQFIKFQLDMFPPRFYSNRKMVIFSTGFFGNNVTKTQEYKWADIVHLHWINGGMLGISDINKIKKPVVWTMRDMWPLTGGCHFSIDCDRYKVGCGYCQQLKSNSSFDLSKMVVNRKKKYIPKSIKLVGISNWLTECAKESFVFKNFDITTIHNNINTNDFKPIQKSIARDILGLPQNKKIILAGAQNFDFYKGFDKLLAAYNKLSKDYFLLFFGNIDNRLVNKLGFEYKSLGFLADIVSMRLAYSSADIFVAPSLIDAFGKTLAESMSCKTPVVCFDATGP
ncbi:glucosyltransferase, partial [Achromatium sp. WMS1]